MNNSLLRDKEFVEYMNQEITTSLECSSMKCPKDRWEIVKKRIKQASVDFSRRKISREQLALAQLSEKVNEYEASLPLTKEEDELHENTKTELEELSMERIRGIMFRSKVKWYEQGERSTKYFYSLEKARYNAKTCYKIVSDTGKEIVTPMEILAEQREFYQKLYSKDDDVKFSLTNIYNVKVPEELKASQDIQLSLNDFQMAIKEMNNDKTPGKDGIPVDFYKVFWNQLKDSFGSMVQQVYHTKLLHRSAREGVLNLIPKANKDTRFIKNLRPITLLNTDYKIIEKAVANKMLPALQHIINMDQRGFMKNRRISVNIRKMLDIIHAARKEDLEAVVLSLDFVKCFDKCSFSILHGSLEFFGFGDIVKEWTRILYDQFSVVIQNNGYFSARVDIKKGVHQGGCCSSLYFLVIAEILALSLRENQDIEGITIADIHNLLNQFADDMDLFSICGKKSLEAIFEELDKFRFQSGFEVSYEKTTLYRIGSLRHSNAQMYDIDQVQWSNEDINVLGIMISHTDITMKNYSQIVDKVKVTLNAWYNRGLTLMGKIQVVNTLVASLFVYKMMVFPIIPEKVVKSVENIIRDFLWNGKKAKIAYKIMQNPKSQGGLNLVDLRNKDIALKATWPQILATEPKYAKLVYHNMGQGAFGENIWRSCIKPEDVKHLGIQSDFWEDVLWSWASYNYYNNQNTGNQLIWYNSNIRIANKPFFWKDQFMRGLLYVHQLFENQQYKSEDQVLREYNLSVLSYNSLKSAIPVEWRSYFLSTPPISYFPLEPDNYYKCIGFWKSGWSRRVYKWLADDVMLIHNKYLAWRKEVGYDIFGGLCAFGLEHNNIYKLTNVTKFRNFQYRLLQRGLVTNVHLEKWGMLEHDLCTFCNSETETITHLLCHCDKVKTLWKELVSFVCSKYSIDEFTITEKSILLNDVGLVKKYHVINFIVLITKQYIYRQRCMKKELVFNHLKAEINRIEQMEKYIAIKNDKFNIHVRKWCDFYGNVNGSMSIFNYAQQHLDQLPDPTPQKIVMG